MDLKGKKTELCEFYVLCHIFIYVSFIVWMYKIACTPSCEMLLALYLGKQIMPVSRNTEMKVRLAADGTAQYGQQGSGGGMVGRSSMDQLQPGKCGVRAFCLCYHLNGAERPDRKLFVSRSRCIELSGAEP